MKKPLFSQQFITFLLLCSAATFLAILWGSNYRRKGEAREQQNLRMELVARGVIERVATIDKLYNALEISADKDMRPLLEKIVHDYDASGKIPDNLAPYLEKFPDFQLYVIDVSNIIIKTTKAEDLGLDFNPYPDFVSQLDSIRITGKYTNPRFSNSIHTGGMIKYSYLASGDKALIFEASLDLSNFQPFMGKDSFTHFISELALSEPQVISVTPFTADGKEFNQFFSTSNPDRERIEQIVLAGATAKTVYREQKTGFFTTYYRYYPYSFQDPLESKSMVIEIVFTDRDNRLADKNRTRETVIASIVFLILIAGINQYFALRFTKPLTAILDTIEKIGQNDFTARICVEKRNETGVLAERINEMIIHIGSLLEEKNIAQGELKKLLAKHEEGFFETVKALAYSIEAKDSYTGGHCERVMAYAILIGTQLGLSKESLETLRYGAILHDIGKIGISDEVLNKQGSFTSVEYTEMCRHPDIGFQIIREIDFLAGAREIVRCHHEKFDGTGYPMGLSGENIPLLARIVCIADAFDAMTSYRHYRERNMTVEEAMDEMRDLAGTQFDPVLVACFTLVHQTRLQEFPPIPEPVQL